MPPSADQWPFQGTPPRSLHDLERAHRRLLDALSNLRTELVDTAYDLEMRRRLDAADLACGVGNRLERLMAEFSADSLPKD